jgi:hypothetical protein
LPHHAASGWRIHRGVEVTESSTNKQHTLSLVVVVLVVVELLLDGGIERTVDVGVCMQNFKRWYLMSGSADAHRFDILADGAASVSHVFPDIVGCTHWDDLVSVFLLNAWHVRTIKDHHHQIVHLSSMPPMRYGIVSICGT